MSLPSNKYTEIMASAFEDELRKIATAKVPSKMPSLKTMGLVGAGAVGYETLRRAERDRRMGRAMRIQNNAY
jgi:lactate dehydrogenase-like 2-hydroxyacid dehydrogenase